MQNKAKKDLVLHTPEGEVTTIIKVIKMDNLMQLVEMIKRKRKKWIKRELDGRINKIRNFQKMVRIRNQV